MSEIYNNNYYLVVSGPTWNDAESNAINLGGHLVSINSQSENDFIVEKFKDNFENKNFNDPIIKNIWDLISEYNISIRIIHDLFDGINSDIKEQVKLTTEKELLIYSYRVAGTVGLMMAKILKVNKKNSLKSAIDLGIAMQLTNISRDVIEDFNNNRIYIDQNFEKIKSTIELSEKLTDNNDDNIDHDHYLIREEIKLDERI